MCCPKCLEDLILFESKATNQNIIEGFLLCNKCCVKYKITKGIPYLIFPHSLSRNDLRIKNRYNGIAETYDSDRSIYAAELNISTEELERMRKNLIRRLQVKPEHWVLDIGTGTGLDLFLAWAEMKGKGKLVGLDISEKMLEIAARRLQAMSFIKADFHNANAAFLPYKDNVFDRVVQVGGINEFAKKKQAIYEMIRVSKPGARILFADEGLSPEMRNTDLGKRLLDENKMNVSRPSERLLIKGIYNSEPPVKLLPKKIVDLKVEWVLSGTFYIVEFIK